MCGCVAVLVCGPPGAALPGSRLPLTHLSEFHRGNFKNARQAKKSNMLQGPRNNYQPSPEGPKRWEIGFWNSPAEGGVSVRNTKLSLSVYFTFLVSGRPLYTGNHGEGPRGLKGLHSLAERPTFRFPATSPPLGNVSRRFLPRVPPLLLAGRSREVPASLARQPGRGEAVRRLLRHLPTASFASTIASPIEYRFVEHDPHSRFVPCR